MTQATARTGPEPTIHGLFERHAQRHPGRPAVLAGDITLTYGQLNVAADKLAGRLREYGVGPEVPVAICAGRTPDFIIGLLAVLKAGGAYVPLDPGYPPGRLNFLLEDSGAQVVLTERRLRQQLSRPDRPVVLLDDDQDATPSDHLPAPCDSRSLAYIIYTSGSTGTPKGVQVSHGNVLNLVTGQDYVSITPGDRVAALATFSFDASTFEIFAPLVNGATCVLYTFAGEDLTSLCAKLRRDQVTVLHLTSPVVRLLGPAELGDLTGVHTLLFGGDSVRTDLAASIRSRFTGRMVHLYGPTETTGFATAHIVGTAGATTNVPIGRPLRHVRTRVADPAGRPVAAGEPGELWIGGRGVARGYLNRPELTDERFVPDPDGAPTDRMYRTGDLVRQDADGVLHFLGRLDRQVKVRGYRVEPGEIESALMKHPGVAEAVVVTRPGAAGEQRLDAYVVPAEAPDTGEGDTGAREYVATWREVFDAAQGSERATVASAAQLPEEDFAGWNSSYDGTPISGVQMREWADTTARRIAETKPTRILEIGCGLGLLLFRLAGIVEEYAGTDLSAGTVQRLAAAVDRQQLTTKVRLLACEAVDPAGFDLTVPDTVVINSVTQYLPDTDYLERMLDLAVGAIPTSGTVYVGDVRHHGLLEPFHAGLVTAVAGDQDTVARLTADLNQSLVAENELLLDPGFFTAFAQARQRVTGIRILPRRGRHVNEMSAYRYDVILDIGHHRTTPGSAPSQDPPADLVTLDWRAAKLNLEELLRTLTTEQPSGLLVRNIPNDRISTDLAIARALRTAPPAALWREVRGAIAAEDSVPLEDLYVTAEACGYVAEVSWAASSPTGDFDLLLHPDSAANPRLEWALTTWLTDDTQIRHAAEVEPATRQAVRRKRQRLVTELRGYLAEALPRYLRPATITVIPTIPLTANLKLDERQLPRPDGGTRSWDPPGELLSSLETDLLELWRTTLGNGEVGAADNFFELGGDSVSAVQLAASVAAATGRQVTVRDVFQHPNVRALAAYLGAVDDSRTARTGSSR